MAAKPKPKAAAEPEVIPPAKPKANLPAAFVAHKFRKGVSGNPSGKSKLEAEVRRMAQRMSPEMLHTIAEIALDHRLLFDGQRQRRDKRGRPPEEDKWEHHGDVRAQIAAASIILERAWGKPKEEEVEELQAPKPNVRALSVKQRAMLLKLAKYMVGAPDVDDDDED